MADTTKSLPLVATGGGPFLKMLALLSATAAFGAFASHRFTHAGAWMPPMPDQIGYWRGIEAPIPKASLSALGNPLANGMQYSSPFQEGIFASVVAAGPFENYHDPTVCVPSNGFVLTSMKRFSLDGPGKGNVRAMVFKRNDAKFGEVRILMYYWQQSRDGVTATEARQGNYRDIGARWTTGFGAVALGQQNVLVRVYTALQPDDPKGVQAQRNVEEISRALYRHLLKVGKEE